MSRPRDEGQVELSYDTKLGECVFEHDSNPGAGHGGGVLRAQPDRAAITTLSELDQTHISKFSARSACTTRSTARSSPVIGCAA